MAQNTPALLPKMQDTRLSLLSGTNGGAGGPSGWTRALLLVVLDSDASLHEWHKVVLRICTGTLPNGVLRLLARCSLHGLLKDSKGLALRPLAVGEFFRREAARILCQLLKPRLPSNFGHPNSSWYHIRYRWRWESMGEQISLPTLFDWG